MSQIKVEFSQWPMPGFQDGLAKYIAYPYDPYFGRPTPGPNTNDFKDTLLQSPWRFFDKPSMKFDYSDLGLRPSRIIDPLNGNWIYNCAGSARPGRLLKGKQYWEVSLKSLPNKVPDNNIIIGSPEYGGPPNGAQAWETSGTFDTAGGAVAYPSMTDPFNAPNPAQLLGGGKPIAFMPSAPVGGHVILSTPLWIYDASATDYDKNGNFQQTVQWTFSYPPNLNTFFNPTIGLWPLDPTFSKNSVIGLDNPFAKTRSIGVTRTSVMCGEITFKNDNDSLSGGYNGRDLSDYGFSQWPKSDSKYHLYGDLFHAPDVDLGPPVTNPPSIARNEFGVWDGTQKGDCAFPGDGGVMLPWGMDPPANGQVIYGAPVFKGRADMLGAIKSMFVDNGGGVWGGIDLGGLVQGDVVMIATDIDSRKVWFGKNGVWSGDKPDSGNGWAAMMDGYAAVGKPGDPNYIPGQSNYYPGISMRVGQTILSVNVGAKNLIYPLPKGFVAYTSRFS